MSSPGSRIVVPGAHSTLLTVGAASTSIIVGVLASTGNLKWAGLAAIALLTVWFAARLVVNRRIVIWSALAALVAINPTWSWPVDPIKLTFYVAVLATVVLVASEQRSGDNRVWVLLALPVLAAFSHWSGVAALRQAEVPMVTLACSMWLASYAARHHPGAFERALIWLLWASVAMAVLAIYQQVTKSSPLDFLVAPRPGGGTNTSAAYAGRSTAIFGHPIIYGTFSGAALILALLVRPRRWEIIVVADLVGMVLSGSRGAWVSISVVLVVLAVSGVVRFPWARLARIAFGMAIVLVAGLIALPSTASEVETQISKRFTGDSSLAVSARVSRLQIGWDLVAHSDGLDNHTNFQRLLTGYGPNASIRYWRSVGSVTDKGALTFDNSYITWLYDSGLIGVAIVVALFAVALCRGELAGRAPLLGLLIGLWFYDLGRWPTVIALIGITYGIRELPGITAQRAAAASPDRAPSSSGPGVRGR